MKKVISVILITLLLLASFPFYSNALEKEPLSLSAGAEALRSEFRSAVAGKEDGVAIDYCYYSPVKKADNNKYPIVIFLHGIGHGAYPGSQLKDSEMVYWASSELQARWTDIGGAFIILPRCPEDTKQYWNVSFVNPLRRMIDDFIEEHRENVDTTRIFIGGSSAGGQMTWDMITTYPEYFAGAFPLSSSGIETSAQIKAAKGVSIWLFSSIFDPLVNYATIVLPLWDKICQYSIAPQNCRLSTFTLVCNPDGKIAGENHRLFQTISFDFFTIDNRPYPNVKTIDGNGNTINFDYPNGIISWMNNIHSDFSGEENVKIKEANPIILLLVPYINKIFYIGNIFQKLLGFV